MKQGKLYLAPKTIKVGGHQFNSEEGFIVVNENPSDTLSRRNMLPVLRIRSASKNPGEPIFWLNGGPGHSNMKYRPFAALLENHDIVLVGYRGVDGSISLKSDKIENALEGADGDLLSDKSLRSLSEALESFSKSLRDNNVDLAHYTIVDVISDLESARNAFGYGRINLLSVSYGTRVALIYSYLHPGIVLRSVMIGAN
ncbi:MAG TPA: alpha/beta fold hydrolase, partial [Bacteroidota bacterium]|nr:alpha/beta fold hydrolase [Bacteroidota bacterium]